MHLLIKVVVLFLLTTLFLIEGTLAQLPVYAEARGDMEITWRTRALPRHNPLPYSRLHSSLWADEKTGDKASSDNWVRRGPPDCIFGQLRKPEYFPTGFLWAQRLDKFCLLRDSRLLAGTEFNRSWELHGEKGSTAVVQHSVVTDWDDVNKKGNAKLAAIVNVYRPNDRHAYAKARASTQDPVRFELLEDDYLEEFTVELLHATLRVGGISDDRHVGYADVSAAGELVCNGQRLVHALWGPEILMGDSQGKPKELRHDRATIFRLDNPIYLNAGQACEFSVEVASEARTEVIE